MVLRSKFHQTHEIVYTCEAEAKVEVQVEVAADARIEGEVEIQNSWVYKAMMSLQFFTFFTILQIP